MSQVLGILGGGQLGCMLHAAATRLGITVHISEPNAEAPGMQLPGAIPADDWHDAARKLGEVASVITWEREDLDPAIGEGLPLVPRAELLAATQDRLGYKQALADLGIATADWFNARDERDADAVLAKLNLPVMVKARRGGFDGRGQQIARTRDELVSALNDYAATGAIVEALVPFDDEFAALITRGHDGTVVHYPLTFTRQEDGQLAWALAPHPNLDALEDWGLQVATAIAEHFGHVGTMAVECFRIGDKAVVNEIAPRVHNSGHWTIEGASTSQFENHVRAVLGLELKVPTSRGVSLLRNCIGSMPEVADAPDVFVHDYRKQARPRRKVGHVTLCAADEASLAQRIAALPASLRAGLPASGDICQAQ